MVLAANRGSVVISQQVRPFAWSNFDPVTRTKVITVESGLGTLVPNVITPWHSNSLGPLLAAYAQAAPTAGAWSVANEAYYYPFYVTIPSTVYKLFWHNGSTLSGNVDCGIYNDAGTRLVSAGSTAQAGVGATQVVDVTDTELDSGRYYCALVLDNATGTVFRTQALTGIYNNMTGIQFQGTAFPLPATATFATPATSRSVVPLCGAAIRSDFV